MDEKKLIEGIKRKDEDTFEIFYNQYKDLVYYVSYQIVKNRQIAEDLLQDIFLTIYTKIDQYYGGSLKYWVIQIVKNTSINYYNRNMKKDMQVILDDNYCDTVEKKSYNTMSLGKYDEILDRNFSVQEKEIIVYHLVFQYSFREISEIMNIHPKQLNRIYNKSLQNMKELLKEAN